MRLLPCAFYLPYKEYWKMVSSFNTNERYIFMKENRCHSIPYRFLDSLRIHNRHPWFHSPCRKGSCSHRPSRRHSNSSRLRRCRRHRKLVPGQYCRGSGIHRTSRPGYSGHNSLQSQARGEHTEEKEETQNTYVSQSLGKTGPSYGSNNLQP